VRVLIAEDEPVSRHLLDRTLRGWGYDPVVTTDGAQAWEGLSVPDAPRMAILDWMMPGMDGVEVCRRVRTSELGDRPYLILVTARGDTADIVAGLEAGANDYVTKPYSRDELRARVQVGARVVELQASLAERIRELEGALAEVKQLQGILPICCYCKKIRNDGQYWERVEDYIARHSGVDFSHGICPDCWENVVNVQLQETCGCRLPYEE
jgi:phosphoserine phosphatase RsbU/P